MDRLYTPRFFEEVKGALAEPGVFGAVVLRESSDASTLEAPARPVMADGLRTVFPSIASASTDDGHYVLASTQSMQSFPLPGDWQRRIVGWRVPRARDVMRSLPLLLGAPDGY